MGNGITSLRRCFADGAGDVSRRHDPVLSSSLALRDHSSSDEGLGVSFVYIGPEPVSSSELHSDDCMTHLTATTTTNTTTTTTFSSISGASISANASSPLSTSLMDACYYTTSGLDKASVFESSDLFASVPLQPVPRSMFQSDPSSIGSGPIERGFLSGPIERGFASGPISDRGPYSGSIDKSCDRLHSNLSLGGYKYNTWRRKSNKRRLVKYLRRAIAKRMSRGNSHNSSSPVKRPVSRKSSDFDKIKSSLSRGAGFNDDDNGDFYVGSESQRNLQWAQGKAGEDRMHVVVSEENGWVFVGIYDGFNGPDAPDFLLSNLYSALHRELKNLRSEGSLDDHNPQRSSGSDSAKTVSHADILNALETALKSTEEAFLEIADSMVMENPELALMGSCVLVMLMRGEDIYLMNVGDSRAVLAQKAKTEVGGIAGSCPDVKGSVYRVETIDGNQFDELHNLISLQLTQDHSTYVEEEVQRIKREHSDDASAILHDRVKGYLKVTRAFGAGFLKQPKWNDALLEMFRIDYIGTSPYLTCTPTLCHHRLGPRDRFLLLSSDGLNQYFTNQEAISEVDTFLSSFPEGDPAQHLIEEVLFRAAKQAGMDFHELLDIPQGDRRRYHDDVSIVIISLEGRIWRSSM